MAVVAENEEVRRNVERIEELLKNPFNEVVCLLQVEDGKRPSLVTSGLRQKQRKFTAITVLLRSTDTGQQWSETFWVWDLKLCSVGRNLLRKVYYNRERSSSQSVNPAEPLAQSYDVGVEYDDFEPPADEESTLATELEYVVICNKFI